LKVAAAVVAVLSVSFSGLTVFVEAFRYRVFDLLFSREAEYNVVIPYEEAEGEAIARDWRAHYFPEYVPEGYRPTESYETGGNLLGIHFVDENQNFIDFQQSPLESSEFLIDNEGGESGQIDIDGETGFWNRHDDMLVLLWTRDETGLILSANNLSVAEIAKIAKSVTYRR
jgi:hypothetical protein